MEEFLGLLPVFSWPVVVWNLMQLLIAYVLAVPIGLDRESSVRSAGLRTFPLVALGSCGYMLIGLDVLEGSESMARMIYGLMTGIGFIGGGAILKHKTGVRGTATAASIWLTGAIGAAVAWQRYEIACLISLTTFLSLHFSRPLKRVIQDDEPLE